MSSQRYTPEFKDEAVRQVIEKGCVPASAAALVLLALGGFGFALRLAAAAVIFGVGLWWNLHSLGVERSTGRRGPADTSH
jgi:transposase-like protein